MSCSSGASSPASHPEVEVDDDPLCITESDRKQFKETEASKRKSVTPDSSDSSAKKQKTDENGIAKASHSEQEEADGSDEENKEPDESSSPAPEIKEDEDVKDEVTKKASSEDISAIPMKDDFDMAEKLKTMNEISIKPVSMTEKEQTDKQNDELDDKVSIEISKKDKQSDRKVTNLRKNIKDVIDDTHLDATTLAAQRQESERLARVQEQQRLIREAQRQMVAEKQANKTQQRVLSILQGEPSDTPCSSLNLDDPILEKFSLSSAVSITPAAKAALQSIQSLISTDDQIPDSDEDDDDDSDDDVMIQPDESMDKTAVVVDSSSDSDDCIILSDEEEEDIDTDDENNSGEHTNDHYNQRDAEGRVVVNIGHDEKEQNIYVAPQIARVIKPHQIGGVRFLFDNIIESTELFSKSTGFGCILAHSMGLGKTLQLVCFCDIFLRHTNSKSILIIMPINTLQNWLHEFNMWLPLPEDVEKSPLSADGEVRPRPFNIYVLNDSQKSLNARAKTVLEWSKEGGVLMMGYEMYRLLSLKKIKPKKRRGSYLNPDGEESPEHKKLFDDIHAALVSPGPDLVVCDEGHRIKNAHASTSLALKQIKSKRRVVLTGYPLQNNLLEYWCMVDFVRPSYLGTKTEFSNMFERPIQNGQCVDSTPSDCKLMRHRAYVLHSLLKGFVQRRSHTVLQKSLPEKTEFVLLVRMTPFQRKLYSVFMDEVVRSKKVPNPLKAFSVCCKIWNHPDVLYNFLKKRELDLDIELEDAETIVKAEMPGPKKRGRKAKESATKDVKSEKKELSTEPEQSAFKAKLNPIRLEPTSSAMSSSESFKPSITATSNDSAYSSSQSTNASYDSATGSYNPYPGYESSSYQNYNYNNGNGYQSWNGSGSNYWQNNQAYAYGSEYNQSYYQQQNSYHQPGYYGNSNYQSFDQKPPLNPKVEPLDVKPELELKPLTTSQLDGGLLADVIKEETKELRDKDSNETKVKTEAKDGLIVSKGSRDDGIPYDWAGDMMKDYISDMLENSPKMELFFCILEESVKLDDRLLVFSQSLLTLNLMERFLTRSKIPNTDTYWAKNTSYFRLDGSTAALEREKLINEFNSNTNVKLFLVSTRAGSLGINLVGANRVVVFDASWNPCHDTQAVCRVYRYGQAKSCYVYRFVMDNCLEKKIYDRQINKQGMADRVVDECNPDANLSMKEVTSLCYDDGVDPEIEDFSGDIDKYTDLVARKMLQLHSKSLTKRPFSHESLLVDRKEKQLTVAEKRLAKRGYEIEKQAASKPPYYNAPITGSNYRAFRTTDGSLIHRPVASVRPMQSELGDALNTVRHPNPKPNRWVPVEVWQSKGLHAQEMTLPQDVSIQTNAADKSKIYLKAGQKVIVLKSPKGICLQLESGKVIAIRASVKSGQQAPGVEQKLGSFSALQNAPQNSGFRPNFPPQNAGDVIDISNDDDEEDKTLPTNSKPLELPSVSNVVPSLNMMEPMNRLPVTIKPAIDPTPDSVYKEKVVYKPNLVQRKPKMPPPSVPSQDIHPLKPSFDSGYRNQQRPPPQPKWDMMKSFPPSTSNYNPRNLNGAQKVHQTSYASPSLDVRKPDEILPRDPPIDSSAFHPPAGAPPSANSYVPPPYSQPTGYETPVYPTPSYPAAPVADNYNYSYHQPPYPNPQPNHYTPQVPSSYNPNYAPYQQGYSSMNYNQIPPPLPLPPHSYPPPINPDPSVPAPYTAPPATSYNGQWNYNN